MRASLAAALLAACSTPGERVADPQPREIELALDGDPRSSIVIEWQTTAHATTTGLLRLGRGEGLRADQLSVQRRGTEAVVIRGDTVIRRAELRDLTPSTAYTYQVGTSSEDSEYWSPLYTFRTAPDVHEHPDAEIVVAVLGPDIDEVDADQRLASEIAARVPDVLVLPASRRVIDAVQPLAASVATLGGDATATYGFAEIAARDRNVVVGTAGALAPAIVDTEQLARNRSVAFVRVRRGRVALEMFAADGTAVTCH